jgi:hypothetical protein
MAFRLSDKESEGILTHSGIWNRAQVGLGAYYLHGVTSSSSVVCMNNVSDGWKEHKMQARGRNMLSSANHHLK